MDPMTEMRSRLRIDWVSGVMSLVTVAALIGAAWYRHGSSRAPESVTIGGQAPPIHLLDLKTSEPLVLVGLGGKVVWVVFWSSGAPACRSSLPELERTWKRLKSHRRFAMVTAAVDAEQPDRVREAIAEVRAELPVYLASPETRRRFGAEQTDTPLHVLIDAEGRIIAMARGGGRATIDRIAYQVQGLLDELDPLGNTRFARGTSASHPPDRLTSRDQRTLANSPRM